MNARASLVTIERVVQTILVIRGQKVMLDADLARLYGVSTKRLNEQVRRNRERFPEDFMFQINAGEKAEVVANCDHLSSLKFSPVLPLAFTEHGAVMLASVLSSPTAVSTGIYIVRAFVRIRELLATHKDLARQLSDLERKTGEHDAQLQAIVRTLRQLMQHAPEKPRRSIGFKAEEPKVRYRAARIKL